jgi:hypothetical protein
MTREAFLLHHPRRHPEAEGQELPVEQQHGGEGEAAARVLVGIDLLLRAHGERGRIEGARGGVAPHSLAGQRPLGGYAARSALKDLGELLVGLLEGLDGGGRDQGVELLVGDGASRGRRIREPLELDLDVEVPGGALGRRDHALAGPAAATV